MIGTFFPEDLGLADRLEETVAGCSTRNVILNAARLLINAIDDELASELIPKARKKRFSILRVELEQKILHAEGRRRHLVRYTSLELRLARKSGKMPSAQIFEPNLGSTSDTTRTTILPFPKNGILH